MVSAFQNVTKHASLRAVMAQTKAVTPVKMAITSMKIKLASVCLPESKPSEQNRQKTG